MKTPRRSVAWGCALAAALLSAPVRDLPPERTRLDALRGLLATASISAVRIGGSPRWVSRADLMRAIAGRLEGGFFLADIDAVRAAALEVDWVRDVSVRRVWPGELHLTVVEERPVARWANDGGGLVTDRGTVLPEPEGARPEALPLLGGPVDAAPRLREGLRELSALLDGIGGGIARLDLSAAGNWTLRFADGVSLVFRGQEGVRRFAAFYPVALEGRKGSIERIDLRYPNGFAVRWRHGGEGESGRRG